MKTKREGRIKAGGFCSFTDAAYVSRHRCPSTRLNLTCFVTFVTSPLLLTEMTNGKNDKPTVFEALAIARVDVFEGPERICEFAQLKAQKGSRWT